LLLTVSVGAQTETREIELPLDVPLGATLEYSATSKGQKMPGVVLMHGSGPLDRDCKIPVGIAGIHPFRHLSKELAQRGFVVLRYDKRSYYAKENNVKSMLAGLTLKRFVTDAAVACQTLSRQPEVDADRIYLVGHSQGGTLSPWVAKETSLAGIVMLAPGILSFRGQVEYQLDYQIKVMEESNRMGLMNSKIAQTKKIQAQYRELFVKLDDPGLKESDLLGGATVKFYRQYDEMGAQFVAETQKLKVPVLLINGTADLKCPEPLLKTKEAALQENPLLTIEYREGMSHELYRNNYLQFDAGVAELIAEWIDET
jgi:dienelactone hydrolase